MFTEFYTGLGLLTVSGMMLGCAFVPMKYAIRWKWENIWLLNTALALFVIPLLTVACTIPNAWHIYAAAKGSVLASVFLFGLGWGVGSVLSGIGYAMLGVGLGASIILGLASTIGSLVPLAVMFPRQLFTVPALVLYLGTLVMVVGLCLTAYAGKLRQLVHESTTSEPDIKAFGKGDICVGLVICIASGILSSMFNLALAFGDSIRIAALHLGVSSIGAVNTLWLPVEISAFAANLAYCSFLLIRNKSWALYFQRGCASHWFIGGVMAVLWAGSISVYGLAVGRLGETGAIIGFPVYIAMSIVTANLVGVITHEWKGAPRRVYVYGAVGMLVLIASVIVVGLAKSAIS